MNSIVERFPIDPSKIDRSQLFLSLTSEAESAGLLAPDEVTSMRSQVGDMLADLIWMRTGGTSTSVKEEEAEELLESLSFTLDCYCLDFAGPGASADRYAACVESMRGRAGVKKCRDLGIKVIQRHLDDAKEMYKKMYATKIPSRNIQYEYTSGTGLLGALATYNAYLAAHVTREQSYPLAVPARLNGLKGILYLEEYIRCLWAENRFCALFGGEGAFEHYGEYNIFEGLYDAAAFRLLARQLGGLKKLPARADKASVRRRLSALGPDGASAAVGKAVRSLIAALPEDDAYLRDYAAAYGEKLRRMEVMRVGAE